MRVIHRYPAVLLLPLLAFLLAGCLNLSKIRSPRGGTNAEIAKFQPVHDIPIPAGSMLDHGKTLVLSTKNQWTGRLVLDTDSTMTKVFTYYADQMLQLGWEPISSVLSDHSVLTFVRGQRAATVQIDSGTISGSTVTVTMTPRQPAEFSTVENALDTLDDRSLNADRKRGPHDESGPLQAELTPADPRQGHLPQGAMPKEDLPQSEVPQAGLSPDGVSPATPDASAVPKSAADRATNAESRPIPAPPAAAQSSQATKLQPDPYPPQPSWRQR